MRNVELLAPGGDKDAIKAAILAGADAVYCGLDKFNARNRAANISIDDLHGILRVAHQNNCQVFITLNILLLDGELPSLFILLNKLYRMPIDGLIIQDIGLAYILNKYFPNFDIHASTQLTTHNEGQISFLKNLKVSRINLSRELSLPEIKEMCESAHSQSILTEIFVHGSQCISFSGACYFSSVYGGNSGNRGKCSQPCRSKYQLNSNTQSYIFNLKDNAAIHHIDGLIDAGADSLKIEGRIKKADYVYTVVDTYRKRMANKISSQNGEENLYKVFNRDFTTGFLSGKMGEQMFISNPRDYSIKHLHKGLRDATKSEVEQAELRFYNNKDAAKNKIAKEISSLSFDKLPISIKLLGKVGECLQFICKTPNGLFQFKSASLLLKEGKEVVSEHLLRGRLKGIEETEYKLTEIDDTELENGVYIPFKEINAFKKFLLNKLINNSATLPNIELPTLEKHQAINKNKTLSVLINDISNFVPIPGVVYYFDMPSAMKSGLKNLCDVFIKYDQLIPYFPSILIGEDFTAAKEFLSVVKPNVLVTNNSGIASIAMEQGIDWIAGPYFNLSNSFSLKALSEMSGCKGAFLSNEMNRQQLRKIRKPDDFQLSFSIYHPILLMTSRQCLIHEASACRLTEMNEQCLPTCNRKARVKNEKKELIHIIKSKGHHHRVFSNTRYLNFDVLKDCNGLFDNYMIDLTQLEPNENMQSIIESFKGLVTDGLMEDQLLAAYSRNTTDHQYRVGL
ncbi:peptidase U32 family protein [Saccharicrinis aurantiacus]|uniref:peptidase U32 family protein n=1 Tax=Saccharicrinis aurantiacus TaxID=1849719 RepID=UPI00095011F7|nr:peptidase U32 family protein [Saccharicrinis aurantiacus]